MKSYCVKERKMTNPLINSTHYSTTKNGRLIMKSICDSCGILKTQFVKKPQTGKGAFDKALKSSKISEQIIGKLIPSTNHMFDRYWSGDMVKGAFNNKTGLFSKKFGLIQIYHQLQNHAIL